jgi:hypothetical protein
LIKEQAESGQTHSAFCAARGISVGSLQDWKRRLGAKSPPAPWLELPVLNSGPDWLASADGRSRRRVNVATQPEHSEPAHAFPSPVEALSLRWLPSILVFVGGALAAVVGSRLPPVWQRS